VLEANPLDDITNTRRIVDVYLLGGRIDRRPWTRRAPAAACAAAGVRSSQRLPKYAARYVL